MDRDATLERQLTLVAVDKPNAELVQEAQAILAAHVPNADGLCVGCYEFARVISIFPCSQAGWALKAAAPCADGGRS
jgi:hypothetical protein